MMRSFFDQPFMYRQRNLTGQSAFTLIELLVVISIIAIVAVIALPIIGRVQTKSYEVKTLSNMRAMGVALLAFSGDNSYQLPGRLSPSSGGTTQPKWPTALQPYVQDLNVYGAPIPDVGGKSYKVSKPPTPYPNVYLNNNTNYTSYIYNGANDVGAYPAIDLPRLNTISQPTKTILLGVPLPQANNFYMDFDEHNESQVLNKTAFIDGTPYVFCDGSARVLTVDPKVDNTAEPASSGTYTDWLWLFDKSNTGKINQPGS